MTKTLLIILLSILLIQISCKKDSNEIATGIYFQSEYSNYAWVFTHAGYTITPRGEVYIFNTMTPWSYERNDQISVDSLQKNINASIKFDTLISKAEINQYDNLTASAIRGTLSNEVYAGNDIGEMVCKVLVPDNSNPSIYHVYILTQKVIPKGTITLLSPGLLQIG